MIEAKGREERQTGRRDTRCNARCSQARNLESEPDARWRSQSPSHFLRFRRRLLLSPRVPCPVSRVRTHTSRAMNSKVKSIGILDVDQSALVKAASVFLKK